MEATPTPAGQEQRSIELSSLEAMVKRFNEAFNRFDAAAVASFWADDGTLISPLGSFGEGRAGVERVFGQDARTILEGSTSRFTISRVRKIGGDCALLDLDHHVESCRLPDGTRGDVDLHVVILAQKRGDAWCWLDARPYRFIEQPPSVH